MKRICPKCGGMSKICYRRYWVYRCSVKACRKEVSVLKFTPFFNSKVDLQRCLGIILAFFDEKTFSEISYKNDVSKKTVKKIISSSLTILFPKYLRNIGQIGGNGVIVEIDESLLVKRKYNRGRLLPETWCVGMVERTPQRKVIFIPVKRRNANILNIIAMLYISKESHIYTDEWRGYRRLENLGYIHKQVKHRRNFVDPQTGVHTNKIEGNWSALKRKIPMCYRREKYLKAFLLRFMMKRNNPDKWREELIQLLFAGVS